MTQEEKDKKMQAINNKDWSIYTSAIEIYQDKIFLFEYHNGDVYDEENERRKERLKRLLNKA